MANRRAQTPKPGNRYDNAHRTKAVQERRFSNAAGVHKGQGEYHRRAKYGITWDED